MKYADGIDRKEVEIDMIKANIRSKTELAKRAGLSRNTIFNFFNGKTPTYNTMTAIINACQMTPDRAIKIFLK